MISRVEPTESYFSIGWRIGTRCNYDCMYCPAAWHDADSRQHSLQKLQDAWCSIVEKTSHHGLPYKILFTGGEVTVNKNFLPFVSWLRQHYNHQLFRLIVTSNGSASLGYYIKMFNSVDNITFSVHSEHLNEKDFFKKIISLKSALPSNKFIHVGIMDEYWNQTRIKKYQEILEQHSISHSVNQIDYSLQSRIRPIIKGKLDLEI